MVAQITSALSSGFTSTQIINFLMKQFPSHSRQIKKAISSGFTAEQILKYLSGGKKELAKEEPEINTEHAKTRNIDIQRRENVNKAALGAVGTGALAIGGTLSAPMAQQALQRAAPQLFGPGSIVAPQAPVTPGATAMQTTPQSLPNQPQILPGVASQQIPSQPPITESVQPEVKPINFSELLNKYQGFESKINDLMKSGNSPEAIALYFKKFNPSQTAKVEKETGKKIDDLIAEYAAQNPVEKKVPMSREEALGAFRDKKMIRMAQEEEQANVKPLDMEPSIEPVKIEKGSTVASPQGIGEIKEIRNGKAIIEVDGKKHQVDEDELEQEPEDTIQTVQELLKIPEVDKSSIVSLFTYDPNESKMYIQFHNGDTYKYLDVDPEKVFKVANKMGIPVTEGKNIFGAWSPEDKKSLGATLIKEIINDPKYKKPKKGEAENPNYIKLETLYDYWEKLRKKSKRK